MTDKQPEALRCADVLEKIFELKVEAAELRRLHEVNKELVEKLRIIANADSHKWVGLTDMEAIEIEEKSPDIRWAVIKAEDKLKDKNTCAT